MDIRVGWPPDVAARMQAPEREVFGAEREEILEALREKLSAFSEEPEKPLSQAGFDDALGKALRLCRLAADLNLPIDAMLEQVENREPFSRDDRALLEIISAVADVAAIGAGLAGQEGANVPQNRPQTAPLSPPERSFPLPANLREA